MTELGGEFDARRVEPAQPFDTIPSGRYLVQIVDSDVRVTKNGKGKYLWFEFDILDGEFTGRKLWDRINRENENQQAVDIGTRTFSALCHAAGKLVVSDTVELHHIPVIATVRFRPAEDPAKAAAEGRAPFDASNEIRGYTAVGGQGQQGGAAQAPKVFQAAMPAQAPWKGRRA